jgi:ABC-2 type transport system ATP-binding protein
MKRRLNLAVALVHNPEYLILDEPTVGVDPQSRNAIFENIEQLKKEGCTIIYTTHYMEEAQRLCDRVGIMDRGKLLALDAVEELIKQHGGNSTIIAEKADGEQRIETQNPIQEIMRLQKETELHGFRLLNPSLETVFLKLTGRTLRD